MKVGYIGCGPISEFHLAAMKANGFEVSAIGTRKQSKSCERFAEKNNLKNYFCEEGWEEVLTKDVDAYVICINPTGTFDVVMKALDKNKPIFIEKPVSFKLDQIINIRKHKYSKNIFVGFNRRFYKTTELLKNFCDSSRGGTIIANIPDSISGLKQIIENGSHIIDTIRFLIGEYELIDKTFRLNQDESDIDSLSAIFKNEKWDILVNAHSLIPSNFYITFNSGKNVCELKPIEQFNYYEGMEVIEPTIEVPIRKYIPKLKNSFVENNEYKPGFDFMYKNFRLFVEKKSCMKCNIEDAEKTLNLCWQLIGSDLANNYKF